MKGKLKLIGHYQNPIMTKKGEIKIIDWHNTLLKNQKGRIIGTLSSGTDITNLDIVQSQLQEIEKKYHAIMNQATDGIVIFDQQGTILEVNQEAARICRHSQIRMVGSKLDALCDPKTYQRVSSIIQDIFVSKKTKRLEHIELRGKKGNQTILNITAQLIKYNSHEMGVLTLTDVTKQQQAIEQSQKQMKKFEVLAEQTADGIMITNQKGEITYVNQAFARMFGYTSTGEIIGKQYNSFLSGQSLVKSIQLFKMGLAGKLKSVSNQYFTAVKKNKDKFEIEASASVLENQGQFQGIECIIREVGSNKTQLKEHLKKITQLEAENKNLKWLVSKLKKQS